MDKYYKYYEDKAKDSEQQAVYLLYLVIIALVFGTWYCSFKWLTHKCPEPQPRIMSIIELQEAVGAEPDGIVGPDTIAAWQQYERDVIFNEYAAPYFTKSGGKE